MLSFLNMLDTIQEHKKEGACVRLSTYISDDAAKFFHFPPMLSRQAI